MTYIHCMYTPVNMVHAVLLPSVVPTLPPLLRVKEGLVYKVGIIGRAESVCSENW